jgi:23S rRNA-/tRNA-specific pseudouridylate synthase
LQFDNHPILGDHLYAGKKFDREKNEENLFFETQALHAYKIKCKDLDGKELEMEAEIPEEFKKALKLIS